MTGHFAPAEPESAHRVTSLPMPSAYFRLFLRQFGQDPALAAQIVEGTGIEPEAAMAADAPDEIELGQGLQQMRNLTRLLRPGWALTVGPFLDNAAHGTVGLAAMSAPTLGESLRVVERFAFVRAPYFRLTSKAGERFYELRTELQVRLDARVWPSLIETHLVSLQANVEAALGRAIREAYFEVDYPEPEYAELYAEHLHAPVSFGGATCAIGIPNEWLPLPCPFADAGVHHTAIERLESSERRLHGEEFIAAQVGRILEGSPDGSVGVGAVASRLRLSRRTLVRRLGRCGTSFRRIQDAYQRQRASELLADRELALAEVADRLGYAEAASFRRACRRWFGTGPRAYRERLGS